jgi:hypothetical protein
MGTNANRIASEGKGVYWLAAAKQKREFPIMKIYRRFQPLSFAFNAGTGIFLD